LSYLILFIFLRLSL